jgi:hypothetical protein
MTDRPYQYYERDELFDKKRELESERRYWEEKQQAFTREYGTAPWVYQDEDYLITSNEISRVTDEIGKILKELELRRGERKEEALSTPSVHDETAHRAFIIWSKEVGWGNAQSYVTTRVDMEWSRDSRHYIGMYYPADNTLVVWMSVAPGTPGAKIIRGTTYLRADSKEQIRHAKEAEQRAR